PAVARWGWQAIRRCPRYSPSRSLPSRSRSPKSRHRGGGVDALALRTDAARSTGDRCTGACTDGIRGHRSPSRRSSAAPAIGVQPTGSGRYGPGMARAVTACTVFLLDLALVGCSDDALPNPAGETSTSDTASDDGDTGQ